MDLNVLNNIKMETNDVNWSQIDSYEVNIQGATGQEYLSLEDVHEDACTQTDGSAICKSVPVVEGPDMEVPYETQQPSETTMYALLDSGLLSSPTRRGRFCFKSKTPNMLKSLKEKHRENERLRHHSLNQHLRKICRSVPGSAEDGKETKVVMMQRIISYMSYLENTIKNICHQLHVTPNQRWTVLTSSLKDIEKAGTWTKEFAAVQSEDSMDSTSIGDTSLRLKLSSPTIDSTTDPTTSDSMLTYPSSEISNSVEVDLETQDALVPSSPGVVVEYESQEFVGMDWAPPSDNDIIQESETFNSLLDHNSEFHQDVSNILSTPTETKMLESPCEVKWLGSPEKSPVSMQVRANHFGIQCDPQTSDDQAFDLSHTEVVSPDKVIPTQLRPLQSETQMLGSNKIAQNVTLLDYPKAEAMSGCNKAEQETVESADSVLSLRKNSSSDDAQIVPLRSSKRKQSSPRRAPLYNITNCSSEFTLPLDEGKKDVCDWIKKEISATDSESSNKSVIYIQPSDFQGVFKEEVVETEDVSESILQEECSKVLREANTTICEKLDLRKSSWMNGFMMYSKIHRKNFIRQNPGYHTAVISKLMGNAWRSMSLDEQRPYVEKARVCSQELQRLQDTRYQSGHL